MTDKIWKFVGVLLVLSLLLAPVCAKQSDEKTVPNKLKITVDSAANNSDTTNATAVQVTGKGNAPLKQASVNDSVKIQKSANGNGILKKTTHNKSVQIQLHANETVNGTQQQVSAQVKVRESNGNGKSREIHAQKAAVNVTELHRIIQEKKQVLNATGDEKLQHRNVVPLAVHTLLAARNLTGNSSAQMIHYMEKFNNSVWVTSQAEINISKHSGFSRFFFGGDDDAADSILRQIEQNRESIREMNRIITECECDKEVRAVLMEQMQHLEQEQLRLQALAEMEKQDKGIFGGLLG